MAEAGANAPRVLIVGAGPAGLLTAQALQMQGASVTVFEQDTALDARPRDWNFGIYWAQTPLAECLPEHIQKEVENAQVDDYRAGSDEVMPIFNGLTQELITKMPIPYNIRLGRRKFCQLLAKGIDVQYNKKIQSVSSDGKVATATFEDGSTCHGDLLIGAEGAHSIVRDFLLGPEKAALHPLPLVASTTLAKLSPDGARKFKEITNRLMIHFHPAGYFVWLSIHDAYGDSQPGEWSFMMIMTWRPTDPEYDPSMLQGDKILADMKQRAKRFGTDFNCIWQAIPDGTRCWHSWIADWTPEPWDNRNGTVTLAGDASHAMTFHRGQGLNNAIHDVAVLSRKIKEKGFTAHAIDEYEREMIPRAREAVESSTENSLAVHDWDKLLQSPLFTKGLKQT